MDHGIFNALMIGAFAGLNRVRGTKSNIGFRNLYIVAPVVGLLAGIVSASVIFGAIVALGYLIWGSFPHGEWLDHNRLAKETDRKYEHPALTFFAKFINTVSFGNDKLAMFIKNLTIGFIFIPLTFWFALPLWTLLATPVLSFLMTVTHEASLKFLGDNQISEIAQGALIGTFVSLFIAIGV